ncbi:MAG: GRP family sugar transporter [Actinomycetota bacterium]|nr:GRP family sugar transporter [Actinomycetota bacterium]MDA2972634.1 GRP family sugar transporter [Actinomycetota bacterium]MDA3001880.1 GRP family sugar transporter [Actinomycetota bacterium]
MLTATLLALGAAIIHAGWNLTVKTSGDRWLALWGQMSAAALVGLPLVVISTFFDGSAGFVSGHLTLSSWGWASLSGLIHTVYIFHLARSYDVADFSVTYPIARGGGALVAAVGGVLLLSDDLSIVSGLGIVIVVLGLGLLAGRVDITHVRAALLVALMIGTYTVVDSKGARSTDSSVYAWSIFVPTALGVTLDGVRRGRWREMTSSVGRSWLQYTITGIASAVTYWMVLAAVKRAPVGYVTVLRESSVVLAAFIGWRYLRESSGRRRIIASFIVLAGLVTLVVGQ